MHIKTMCLFSLVVFLALIPLVHAGQGGVDLSAFPAQLAEKLNISLFAAQLLVSSIFLALFLFPTMMVTRNVLGMIGMTFIIMSFCLAMGWLPVWVFLVSCLLIATLMAGTVRGWITGGPSKGD